MHAVNSTAAAAAMRLLAEVVSCTVCGLYCQAASPLDRPSTDSDSDGLTDARPSRQPAASQRCSYQLNYRPIQFVAGDRRRVRHPPATVARPALRRFRFVLSAGLLSLRPP